MVEIITFSRDITERKTKEEALITEEKRLKMALNAARMGIWEWYVKDDKIVWDENTERLYDLEKGAFNGTFEMFMQFIHPDERKEVAQKMQGFASTGKKDWRIVHRIVTKKGKVLWVQGLGEMFFDDQGEPIYMIGVTSDITQKITFEEEIKKLALVAENTDNAVIISDKEGRIEWVNQGFTKIAGYTLDEVVGLKPGDFLQGDASDKDAIQQMREAINNLQTISVELVNYNKQGEAYWIAIDLQPVFAKDGRHSGFISLQRDVTQNKAHEKALAQQNDALLKTNKELDNFVYRISHDLRAPVSSSLGLINLAKMELQDTQANELKIEKIEEYFKLLNKSMLRMDGFISDILDYSRNARVGTKIEAINLHDMVNDIYQQYKFLNKTAHLVLINRLEPEKIFMGDQLRLNIILSNLISNSFKFLDKNKEENTLEVLAKWHPNKIELSVRDNGVGIEEVYQSQVFDMFFRGSNYASGSGLGLYIVKESLDRINGSIKVKSKPHKGTNFTMFIPYAGK